MKKLILFPVCLLLSLFVAAAVPSPATNSPPPVAVKMKPCFQCNGLGKMACPTCRGTGQMPCPGACLKLSQPGWQHMEVAGHPPTDIWMKFTNPGGGWQAYNQNHVGDVIKLVNGTWTDTGKCPTCGGTGTVKCRTCNATGIVTCNLCDGKGSIPATWTTFDNPKMKNRPKHFTLKDGRVLVGRKSMVMGSTTTIRTEKGDVDVDTASIVSEDPPSTTK